MSFNPSNPNMKNIYLKHLHLLARMKRNPITQENTQIVYRKSQNLRDLLVTGIINKTQKPPYRCTPCRDQRKKDCISCDRIVHSNIIAKEHLKYKIRGYFNCQSENCIYSLIATAAIRDTLENPLKLSTTDYVDMKVISGTITNTQATQ